MAKCVETTHLKCREFNAFSWCGAAPKRVFLKLRMPYRRAFLQSCFNIKSNPQKNRLRRAAANLWPNSCICDKNVSARTMPELPPCMWGSQGRLLVYNTRRGKPSIWHAWGAGSFLSAREADALYWRLYRSAAAGSAPVRRRRVPAYHSSCCELTNSNSP